MGRKKKEDNKDEVVVLEKIEKTKSSSGVSEVFYYLLGLVIGIVLIFATEELLSTINYLFVVIFAIIAVIQLIGFIMDKKYDKKEKINFALKKENTICSLFEVEKFLRSGTKIINGIKLFNILKN